MTCDHCGATIPRGTGGLAVIDDTEINLCHPDDPDALDCYWLVTVGPEPVGYRKIYPDEPIVTHGITKVLDDFYNNIMESL